jgi:hypothetical protein
METASDVILSVKNLKAYFGFIKHRGEWHNGNFEPILSPTLFEAVQKVLTSRKKQK